MLTKLSFNQKIGLLLGSAIAGIAIVAGISVWQTRTEIIQGKQAALRTAVQSAQSIVLAYQARVLAGTLSEADAKKAAADAIRPARYGGDEGKSDYFFIFARDGTGVMHPFKRENC